MCSRLGSYAQVQEVLCLPRSLAWDPFISASSHPDQPGLHIPNISKAFARYFRHLLRYGRHCLCLGVVPRVVIISPQRPISSSYSYIVTPSSYGSPLFPLHTCQPVLSSHLHQQAALVFHIGFSNATVLCILLTNVKLPDPPRSGHIIDQPCAFGPCQQEKPLFDSASQLSAATKLPPQNIQYPASHCSSDWHFQSRRALRHRVAWASSPGL